MTAMLPVNLTETLNDLGAAAREVSAEVSADREQRVIDAAAARAEQKRYNRRTLVLFGVIAALVLSLVLISVANRRLGVANSALNRQNAKIIERIESCTTEGGDCYQENTRRTDEAIGRLIAQVVRTQVAIAVCVRAHPDAGGDEIEACATKPSPVPSEAEEPPPSGQDPDGEPIPTVPPGPAPTGD